MPLENNEVLKEYLQNILGYIYYDIFNLRNHHHGRGLCEQIKFRGFSPRPGFSADNA